MNPDLQQVLLRLDQIDKKVDAFILSDRYRLLKDIEVGFSRGAKIGTKSTQKLGFFGKTPTAQIAAITSPSGGGTVDTQARTAIDAIRTALTSLGLTA